MEPDRALQGSPGPAPNPNLRFSVLIISEVRLLGEGLAQALAREERVSVCRYCGDLDVALDEIARLEPDVVLLDAAIRQGSASIGRIRSTAPGVRVVALALAENTDNIVIWAEAGVVGYIPRTAALYEVVPLLANIMRGEQTCSGRVAAGLLRRLRDVARSGSKMSDAPAPMLTARELQTLELIGNGLSNKEIARHLKIELGTTKSHVHNLLRKLSLQRRGQAALWMREHDVPIGGLSRRPPSLATLDPRG